MSSPIDLTVSDDEILSSRPRSQGKRKVLIDLEGVDDTPTKRSQRTPGGYSPLPSSGGSRRDSVLSPSVEDHTPTKRTMLLSERNARHSSQHTSRRGEANVTASHQTLAELNPPPLSFTSPPSPPAANGDDSDDEVDEAFELEETTRLEYEQAFHHRDAKRIPEGHKLVDSAKVQGVSLKPGMSIELQDGGFLRIVYIFRDKSGEDMSAYLLRGILLRRNANAKMDNKFPKIMNELVAMISIPKDDNRPHLIAGLQDRPLTEYARIREVRFPNAGYKEFSFREDESEEFYYHDLEADLVVCNEKLAFEKAPLVCRSKSVERWHSNLKPYSEACLRLQPEEADAPYRRSNMFLIHQYFRETRGRADGGPSNNTAIQGGVADLYCGGGGGSEAAGLTGFSIAIGVDNKECAVRTHQHNHPGCLTIHSDVFDFVTSSGGKGHFICDLCHLSCPCQPWSPNHTVAGKNDDANKAASFMVESAVKKLGCRIMTSEQTPGFSRIKEHRPQWNAFIQRFTSLGFSVEWKIISFADTGCANKRSRIWMFATCPGQQMPKDIEATHGPLGSGLLPYVTIREVISNIPAGATLHDPQVQADRVRRAGGVSSLPTAEWDKPLQHLIDTSGPKALHPSGTRRFTVRETLCLQGFGTHYQHIGDEHGQPPSRTESMRMAGNAIPPKPAAPYFASAKEALRITDEELAACENEVIE